MAPYGLNGPSSHIRFENVAAGSPFGLLLRRSLPDGAEIMMPESVDVADRKWRAALAGTSLQPWADGPRAHPHRSNFGAMPAISVDFWGLPAARANHTRLWRVVDGSGEPILNAFCFLEGCCRRPFVAAVLLLEETPTRRDWAVIGEAHISNLHWYPQLLDRVAQAAADLIACALQRDPVIVAKGSCKAPAPRSRSRAAIFYGLIRAKAMKTAIQLRDAALAEHWAIGVLSSNVESLTHSQVLRPHRWIESKNGSYLADPFPHPHRANAILCEEFDRRSARGVLRSITISGNKVIQIRTLSLGQRPNHVSYPFVFKEGSRTYFLPEMQAFGKSMLFEIVDDDALRPVCTVRAHAAIADPTLFKWEGLYWIAYCDQSIGTHDNLCLLYSRRIEGPWTPHSLNPVKRDIRSSRPGGTPFCIAGDLFRPAQNCSATYGGSLVLNLVRKCTPEDYIEEPVAALLPDAKGAFPHGLHTLSIDGPRILIDGKKLFVDPALFFNHARLRAPRLIRRLLRK